MCLDRNLHTGDHIYRCRCIFCHEIGSLQLLLTNNLGFDLILNQLKLHGSACSLIEQYKKLSIKENLLSVCKIAREVFWQAYIPNWDACLSVR